VFPAYSQATFTIGGGQHFIAGIRQADSHDFANPFLVINKQYSPDSLDHLARLSQLLRLATDTDDKGS
jgi:hypothetical protein